MANVPADLKYTEDHEWVRVEDGNVVIGVTDFAQGELGDVVFLELPTVGDTVEKGEAFGSIEAVKTVADIYAPLNGEVLEVNEELDGSPELVNGDPYGEGWFIKVKPDDLTELDGLMDAEAYEKHIA